MEAAVDSRQTTRLPGRHQQETTKLNAGILRLLSNFQQAVDNRPAEAPGSGGAFRGGEGQSASPLDNEAMDKAPGFPGYDQQPKLATPAGKLARTFLAKAAADASDAAALRARWATQPLAVVAVLARAISAGRPPATLLAHLVREWDATGQAPVECQPMDVARLVAAVQGYPTGSRFVRGSHAGSFVRDPLGYDRATYDVPWSRPSLRDMADALGRGL